MSLAESCASSPSMYASDSPSPAPSASQTPHHYTNGYHHNGSTDFSRFGSPGPQNPPSTPGSQCPNSEDHHSFIKRPLNAYMIWTVEERKKILAKDPKMKMNDVSRIMGEKWKSLTDKEKRPYFEQSKQYKLDHKRALKENPDLLYRPQRKKPSKGNLRQELPMDNSSISAQPTVNGMTPTAPPRFNGCATNVYQCQSASQGVTQSNGTVLVAQPIVYSPMQLQSTSQGTPVTVTFQTPQAPVQSVQRTYQQPVVTPRSVMQSLHPPVNASQMLDMYYTSLCQPAFPEPGETNNMAPPQYYLDQYQQLHLQTITASHAHHSVTAGYGSCGAA